MFGDVLTMSGNIPVTKFDGNPKTWSLRVGNRDTRWGLGWGSNAYMGFGGVPDPAITTFPLEGGEVCVRAFFYDTRGGDALALLTVENSSGQQEGEIYKALLMKSVTLKAEFTNKANNQEKFYFRAVSPYCVMGNDMQTFETVVILRFKSPDRFKEVFLNRDGVVWSVSMTLSSAKCDPISARGAFRTNPSYWGNFGDTLPYSTYQNARRAIHTGTGAGALRGQKIGDLPNDLFAGVQPKTLESMFENCYRLVVLPPKLFDFPEFARGRSLKKTFRNVGLLGVPKNLLDRFEEVTSVESLFDGCVPLKKLPAGFSLPDVLPAQYGVADYNSVFRGCNITEIPKTLFLKAKPTGRYVSFLMTFAQTKIEEIPDGLFEPFSGDGVSGVTMSGTFVQCTELTRVPENILKIKKLTSITGAFRGCLKLKRVTLRLSSSEIRTATDFAPNMGDGWTIYAPRGSQTVKTLQRDVPRATVIEYDTVD